MRNIFFALALTSCTNIDSKIVNIPEVSNFESDDFCSPLSVETKFLLKNLKVRFKRITQSLSESIDYYAYYDDSDSTIYFSDIDPVFNNFVCVHELWHGILRQKEWVLNYRSVHFSYIEKYFESHYTLIELNQLIDVTKNTFTTLLDSDLPDYKIIHLRSTFEKFSRLTKFYNDIIDNPLKFNIDNRIKRSLKTYLFAVESLLRNLVDAGFSEFNSLIQNYSVYSQRFFIDYSFEEFLVQALTTLVVTTSIPSNHLQTLDSSSIDILSDLKIDNLDLTMLIDDYKQRNPVLK